MAVIELCCGEAGTAGASAPLKIAADARAVPDEADATSEAAAAAAPAPGPEAITDAAECPRGPAIGAACGETAGAVAGAG